MVHAGLRLLAIVEELRADTGPPLQDEQMETDSLEIEVGARAYPFYFNE